MLGLYRTNTVDTNGLLVMITLDHNASQESEGLYAS